MRLLDSDNTRKAFKLCVFVGLKLFKQMGKKGNKNIKTDNEIRNIWVGILLIQHQRNKTNQNTSLEKFYKHI